MLDGPFGPQELWDAFGPTYPCVPRERIGDVLDGGKWCGGLDPEQAYGLRVKLRSQRAPWARVGKGQKEVGWG